MSSWFTAPMTRVRILDDGSDYDEFVGFFSLNLENLAVIRWGYEDQPGWEGIREASFRETGETGITYYCTDRPSLEALLAYFGVLPGTERELEVVEAVG